MCKKCENIHSQLFQNHYFYNLDKNPTEIFTGFCFEKDHLDKLEYFCKTHNKLCCASCVVKFKKKGKGQHTDCDVCILEDIKETKKNNLNNNIKTLENLSTSLNDLINNLKNKFEKINENKEEIKLKIQKIFTKIRNAINNREDELLMEVDKKYDNLYFKEDLIKEWEKLPNKINNSLEKGKLINKDWDNNYKICSFINDCINIENMINSINLIKNKIENSTNPINTVEFQPNTEKEINFFIDKIKTFGKFGTIYEKIFRFKENKESQSYLITGEERNIVTKTKNDNIRIGIICENILEKDRIYKWKIKILQTESYDIMVGVAPSDYNNILKKNSYQYGWFFSCDNQRLYSGPPFNYISVKTNINKPEKDIIVIMNMNKGTLKFIVDDEDKGDSYIDIPLDKPLSPAVNIYNVNDSLQIINFEN